MAISLTEIIAALEAKANATDSSTAISDILRLTQASEKVSDGTILYDSAGVMPTDSAFIGTLAATSAGTIYFYNGTAWNAVDSAETIAAAAGYSFQGSVSGYTSGGISPPSSPYTNIIDKFLFATDANATDVGDLTYGRQFGTGQSSSTNGYHTGGTNQPSPTVPNETYMNLIEKFPFSTDGNASDVGDLVSKIYQNAGQSSSTHGYSSGGQDPASTPTYTNIIQKFPFSTDTNATDVGDLTGNRAGLPAGQSSTTHGYSSGGSLPPYTNIIDKFPFSTDTNATDVGDLTAARYYLTGQSSSNNGYSSGGFFGARQNIIDKFPFSTDTNATDVGDLTAATLATGGQSSTTHGYNSGGSITVPAAPFYTNVINKFPFTTDTNATDVGDLTVARGYVSGQQV